VRADIKYCQSIHQFKQQQVVVKQIVPNQFDVAPDLCDRMNVVFGKISYLQLKFKLKLKFQLSLIKREK
jgi:hypothetical protein